MTEDQDEKEKFDFDLAGEALDFVTVDQARLIAIQAARGAWQLRAGLAISPNGVRGRRRRGHGRRLFLDSIFPP